MVESGFTRLGRRLGRAPRGVDAVENRQHMWTGTLHAQRHAGEAGVEQPVEPCGTSRFGVRLGGDLNLGREPELVADGPDHPTEVGRGQQARRPATDEDRRRGDVLRTEHTASQPELGDGTVCPGCAGRARIRTQLVGGVGVEIAVPAPGGTERHMQVDAEWPGTELGQGARRQRAVSRRWGAVGQGGGHMSLCLSWAAHQVRRCRTTRTRLVRHGCAC